MKEGRNFPSSTQKNPEREYLNKSIWQEGNSTLGFVAKKKKDSIRTECEGASAAAAYGGDGKSRC